MVGSLVRVYKESGRSLRFIALYVLVSFMTFFGNESGRRTVSDSEKLPRNPAVTICCGTIRVH